MITQFNMTESKLRIIIQYWFAINDLKQKQNKPVAFHLCFRNRYFIL